MQAASSFWSSFFGAFSKERLPKAVQNLREGAQALRLAQCSSDWAALCKFRYTCVISFAPTKSYSTATSGVSLLKAEPVVSSLGSSQLLLLKARSC